MKKQWRSLASSSNYKNNRFENLSPTAVTAEGVSFGRLLREYFRKPANVTPSYPLPSIKTDLRALYSDTPVITWFGHSSYLIHCKGTNILVDPVFSSSLAPVPGLIKAYPVTHAYTADDMPDIDLMIITHDHYDHLDRKTITQLKNKAKAWYTPLGVGGNIAGCGVDGNLITEMDWWETEQPLPGITLTATPARHFSGRGLRRGVSLWASFVLEIYGHRIFVGGDSGYDTHFKTIGEKYGPFDMAVLECGQYNPHWPHIHMMPEETAQAALDLRAKMLLPVHWGKFTLAYHPWNESIKRVLASPAAQQVQIATPMIGEPASINPAQQYSRWWLTE
ncbi:MBL fold metallo-hydrolase [Chitinophaga agrisoli]|uniref:MBL fold metallo-hydrolase n=1 Tax=Chitinophaga agrisoli TaxID=2607653 RepID=A0A5B2VS74_9BACT|nr:MBL fold metallo-hydrolase [Chitinophaga agrisoli]